MKNSGANNPTVLSYARSLLELANEGQLTDGVGSEMGALRTVMEQNPALVAYLSDPGIGASERTATLGRVFKGASGLVHNFLGVLNEKGRLRLLPSIAEDALRDILSHYPGLQSEVVTFVCLVRNVFGSKRFIQSKSRERRG